MARKKRRVRRRVKRRSNPTRARRVVRYAKGTFAGIRIGDAAKATIPLLFGAVAAKFTAKKFAEGGAEADNWTWKNYLLCLLGGFVAAAGTSSILKSRKSAQKVMEGAFLLAAYKFFTNELAPKSPTLEAWFGADDEFDPYAGYGDIWQGGETDYIQGVDGAWRPVDESHRLPQVAAYGDSLQRPSARFGDVVSRPSARFGAVDSASAFERAGM